MDEVRARPAPPVEALPTIVQAPPFAYQAGDMRSPFDPPVVLKRVERPAGGVRVEPDIRRQREYLEQFPVTSLAMVGSIAQDNRLQALVRDGAVIAVEPKPFDLLVYLMTHRDRVLSKRELLDALRDRDGRTAAQDVA